MPQPNSVPQPKTSDTVPALPSVPDASGSGEPARAGAQTARLFKRIGGGFEEVQPDGTRTPRRPFSPRPEPDPRRASQLFGVGTIGLGQRDAGGAQAVNDALAFFQKEYCKQMLDFRSEQIAADRARRAANIAKSPRELMLERGEKLKERKERLVEELDKRNEGLSKERKQREAALRATRESEQGEMVQQVEERRQARTAMRPRAWQYLSPDTGNFENLPPEQTDALEAKYTAIPNAGAIRIPACPAFGPASPGGVNGMMATFDPSRGLILELPGHEPITVRRRRAVRCAQNGLRSEVLGEALKAQRQLGDQMRSVASVDELASHMHSREPQGRRRMMDQENHARRKLQNHYSVATMQRISASERDASRQRVKKMRQRLQNWTQQQKEEVTAARQAKVQTKEQFKERSIAQLEDRTKRIKEERHKDLVWRAEFNEQNREEMRQKRDRDRATQASALTAARDACQASAPLKDQNIKLSRAQWHSRAHNLESVQLERQRRAAQEAERIAEREAEIARCSELHNMVLAADAQRRRRGIAGGGAGFGERSGGIVEISAQRRHPIAPKPPATGF